MVLVAERSCGCPILRSAQGQTGWGFGQPDKVPVLLVDGFGLDDLKRSLPNQTIPLFYYFTVYAVKISLDFPYNLSIGMQFNSECLSLI